MDERVLSVTKMKDAPTPEPMGFNLVEVTLPWKDEDDNPEKSVVLEPTGSPVVPKKGKKDKPTANQRLGFQALLAALEAHGTTAPSEGKPDGPQPDTVVHLKDWRTEFYARHTGDNQEAKKKAFQRARKDLTEKNAVGVRDDLYWPTPELSRWDELSAMMGIENLLERKL